MNDISNNELPKLNWKETIRLYIEQFVKISSSIGTGEANPGSLTYELTLGFLQLYDQARINKFVTSLLDRIPSGYDLLINKDYMQSEDFVVLFNSILRKVVIADSEDKLERFKQILLGQIINPTFHPMRERFLEITLVLTEKQLIFLRNHAYATYKQNKIALLIRESNNLSDLGKLIKTKLEEERDQLISYSSLGISDRKEFMSIIFILQGLGVMYTTTGALLSESNPLSQRNMTKFGFEYLKFILNYEHQINAINV